MQPNPIADTVRAASPLPNVRCLRTAAKLAGIFLADTDDSPLMAFSAACTFFNAGETQIAVPVSTVAFRNPRRLNSFRFSLSVFMLVISINFCRKVTPLPFS